MTKIEISDEMVRRGVRISGNYVETPHSRELVRNILEAALNSPREPEIEVTDAMREAGYNAYCKASLGIPNPTPLQIVNTYRAMEAERRKAQKYPVEMRTAHGRSSDLGMPGYCTKSHRRKDDPK